MLDKYSKDEVVHIVFSGLSDQKAYEIESKLIYFFGSIYESKRKQSCLYNLDIPKKPKLNKDKVIYFTKREINNIKGGEKRK